MYCFKEKRKKIKDGLLMTIKAITIHVNRYLIEQSCAFTDVKFPIETPL